MNMRKAERSTISHVLFQHVGTDKDFDLFLRSMLRDYLAGGDEKNSENNYEHTPGYSPEGVVCCCADEESSPPKGE